MNKSQGIECNFQKQVIKHLKGKGFNCIVQSAFPNIFAWKPFMDGEGRSPILFTQASIGDKIVNKQLVPFFVALVECNSKNKYLNKKKKEEVKKILEEERCNVFLVAYKDKKNRLEFQEINLRRKQQYPIEPEKKEIPSYLG